MNAYPLIRKKWSNEHVMAAVFLVLILYHIPGWSKAPAQIGIFLILTIEGLILDAVINCFRYKRLWCSVSAAVTAGILSVLTMGMPLWGRMLGVMIALILGKHLWGGIGRNLINPALTGVLFLMVFFPLATPIFPSSYLLLPAVILSVPFLMIRPFAGIGYLIGVLVALGFHSDFTLLQLLSFGGFFFAGMVITDPVTITNRPVIGTAVGLTAGFTAMFYKGEPVIAVVGILAGNLLSYLAEEISTSNVDSYRAKFRLKKIVPYPRRPEQFLDLTIRKEQKDQNIVAEKRIEPSPEHIIKVIKENDIYGMGGAAFSTWQKIKAVQSSKESQKYLIVNGVECDPGLIHDWWLLRNHQEEICNGIKLLRKCVAFSSVYLAVKDRAGLNYPEDVKIHKVPDRYPAGAEKILISEVIGRKLPNESIPADFGILVLNVQTVYSIWEAVSANKKSDTRFLTAADLKNQRASVVKVRLGMKIHDVMEAVYPEAITVYTGGGLMQSHLAEEDAEIEKTTNFIASAEHPKYKESPQCSKCGSCSSNCPVGLKVKRIADLVDQGKAGSTEKYYANLCISCGSCSYVCPAGRNLSAKVKAAKDVLKQQTVN